MSNFINAGEGIDVDVFLNKVNREKAIDKVAQKIRLNRSKFKNMQDTSTDYEEISGSIQAGYYIKNGMANNEDLYYDCITEKEYYEILEIFEKGEEYVEKHLSPQEVAVKILGEFIGRLNAEIRSFEFDLLPLEEQVKLLREQEERRERRKKQ